MEWTISSTDRNWLELADILRREWQGWCAWPDMRHTLPHLCSRLGAPTH